MERGNTSSVKAIGIDDLIAPTHARLRELEALRARNKYIRRIVNATKRAHAPGREERMAAADAKRDRKNAKRAQQA